MRRRFQVRRRFGPIKATRMPSQLLACAGVNGDEEALQRFAEIAAERKPDAILFAGGILAADTQAQHRAAFIARFFQAMGAYPFAAVIPGPHETPPHEFYRAALNAEVVFPSVFSVHAAPITQGDMAVCGLGGMVTEDEDGCEPVFKYSHASAEYFLRGLWQATQPIKVLLLSEPPPGILSGGDGNPIIDEFIKSYHPSYCIVCGRKESRGVEKVASSMVVNPGMLSEGSAAWISRIDERVELLDL